MSILQENKFVSDFKPLIFRGRTFEFCKVVQVLNKVPLKRSLNFQTHFYITLNQISGAIGNKKLEVNFKKFFCRGAILIWAKYVISRTLWLEAFKGTKKSLESPKWVTFRANRLSYNSCFKLQIL